MFTMFTKGKLLPALGLIGLLAGGAAHAQFQTLPVLAGNAFTISGSTALDNQVKAAVLLLPAKGGLCTAGTVSVYSNAPLLTAQTSNYKKGHQTLWVCLTAAAIG